MIDVVSVKHRNRGKIFYFDPNGLAIKAGDKLVVETAKGLELVDCCRGIHAVMDTAVVQPLRPVVRIATEDDLRIAQANKARGEDAFRICQKKIAEHGLDMKLVDVECGFEGGKITFFFTSDGRVDFRELVKDLAGVFRSRIELRQIGVRDEAKMLGGIGICGRPYCCSQFLDDFQPVSTKMAKIQSLSLNPTKISGSCGRLMCCLRYEQEAYEELIKSVPKQGACVETKDGYGTAVQVNLLRQTVQVRLDDDSEDTLRSFKANELAAVPGGRPKDGEAPPSVLHYVPPEPEEDEEVVDEWAIPEMVVSDPVSREEASGAERRDSSKRRSSRRGRGSRSVKPRAEKPAPAEKALKEAKPQKERQPEQKTKSRNNNQNHAKSVKVEAKSSHKEAPKEPAKAENKEAKAKSQRRRNYYHSRPKSKRGEGQSSNS